MKTIVYCHTGLIYRVPDKLYDQFIRASRNDINDPEALQRINGEIAARYKPMVADYMATAADEENGLLGDGLER